jgi:hypothetical protein
MSYDSFYPTFRHATQVETDLALCCAAVILLCCPACEHDSIIGHGRRRKQL